MKFRAGVERCRLLPWDEPYIIAVCSDKLDPDKFSRFLHPGARNMI